LVEVQWPAVVSAPAGSGLASEYGLTAMQALVLAWIVRGTSVPYSNVVSSTTLSMHACTGASLELTWNWKLIPDAYECVGVNE